MYKGMFGGNFGGTCDSRFSEAVREFTGWDGAVPRVLPIHDREEIKI